MKSNNQIEKISYMIKLLIINVLLLFPFVAKSQYKITITDSNTYVFNKTYLLDVPLIAHVSRLYIDDKNGNIPVEAFASFEGHVDTLIVTDRFKEYVFYYIKNVIHRIDTLNHIKKELRHFIEIPKPDSIQTQNSICVYYRTFGMPHFNSDGSGMSLSSINSLSIIASFQKENNAKITDTYTQTIGYEGETNFYFTFTGLSGQLKAKLLNTERYCCIPNAANIKIADISTVFIPI